MHHTYIHHCICDILKLKHYMNKQLAVVYICTASILVLTWLFTTSPSSPYQTPIVLELFKVLYTLGEWAVGTLFVVSWLYSQNCFYMPQDSNFYSCFSILQVVDLFVALCLAKITVLHGKEQVPTCYPIILHAPEMSVNNSCLSFLLAIV